MNNEKDNHGKLIMRDFLPQWSTGTTITDFQPAPPSRGLSTTSTSIESDSQYETFPALITQANEWLHANPSFSVHTCETVDFKLHNHGQQPRLTKSTFRARGERPNCYIRGLRVWVFAGTSQSKRPDQIDYVNVLPRWKTSDPEFAWLQSDVESEPLSGAVARLNGRLRGEPLDGRICSVHTFSVKFTAAGPLPDRAVWRDRGYAKQHFLVGLRVFYVKVWIFFLC